MIDCWQYIFSFTAEERIRIRRDYELREWRTLIGVLAGVMAAAGVFLLQLPWYGEPHLIHAYLSYGALPVGVLAGAWVRHWIPHHVHRRWMTVWHPIARERRAAHGWETLTPTAPRTLSEIIDRHYIALDRQGCTALVMGGLFLAMLLLAPAAMATDLGRWLWLLLFLGWAPAGLILGPILAKR